MQKNLIFSRLAGRLGSVADLSDEDIGLLSTMPCTIASFPSKTEVSHDPELPPQCSLLLRGYLCYRDQRGGLITSIHVPGDVADLHAIEGPQPNVRLSTLGPAVVAAVPHTFFVGIASRSPTLARAFQLHRVADQASLRNWCVNIGSRDALPRVAHLICEIAERLRAIGLADNNRFSSPFNQSDLASACAITPVHANRVVQTLRRRSLLTWKGRTISISDWKRLCVLAGFDDGYLCLVKRGSRVDAA